MECQCLLLHTCQWAAFSACHPRQPEREVRCECQQGRECEQGSGREQQSGRSSGPLTIDGVAQGLGQLLARVPPGSELQELQGDEGASGGEDQVGLVAGRGHAPVQAKRQVRPQQRQVLIEFAGSSGGAGVKEEEGQQERLHGSCRGGKICK